MELVRAIGRLPNRPQIILLTTERTDPHGLWQDFEHHPVPGCHLLPALLTYGQLGLGRAAQHHRLDLIHDPNGIAPFLGPSGGARRVVTIHDAFAYVCPEEHNRLDNWRYRLMLPHLARQADAVLTDSETSREDLRRYLAISAEKLQVIACGVDPRFAPVPDGRERRAVLARHGISAPYLLYVGAVNGRKNIARLLDAYTAIRSRHPGLSLVIVGKRQWRTPHIDTTAEGLERDGQVRVTGYLDDADLPALYSAAEVFIFPSLYEGFGLPPLEAMACGTPVVSSWSSSLPEVVGDAAILVDPLDVTAIAAGIERVLLNRVEAAELRAHGLARARQFTWERTARETVALYDRVLAGTRAAP